MTSEVALTAASSGLALAVAVWLHRRSGWLLSADCAGFAGYMRDRVLVERAAIEITVRNRGRTPVSVNGFLVRVATTRRRDIEINLDSRWTLVPFRLDRQVVGSGQTRSWVFDVEPIAQALMQHPQFPLLASSTRFRVRIALGSGRFLGTRRSTRSFLPTFRRVNGRDILTFSAPVVGTLDLDRRL